MFDSILIRPNSSRNHPFNMGEVVETLLYYQKTDVHMSRGDIYEMTKTYHEKDLEALLKRKSFSVYYKNSTTAVIAQNNQYSVDSIGLADLDIEKLIYTESKLHTNDRTKSRSIARRLAPYFKEYQLPQQFAKTLAEQLRDDAFRKLAAVETLRFYNPGVEFDPADIRFDIHYTDDYHFTIDTNIDFQKFSKTNSQSPVLSLINTAEDLYAMAESSSEISVPEFNSLMMRGKITDVLARTEKSNREKDVLTIMFSMTAGIFGERLMKARFQ